MLELDDKISAMAPELSPDEALAVDSQLDDRAVAPVVRPTAATAPADLAGGVAEAGRDRHRAGLWQLVVMSGWRPEYVLPAPATVFDRLGELIADGTVFDALRVTGERALYGYAAR